MFYVTEQTCVYLCFGCVFQGSAFSWCFVEILRVYVAYYLNLLITIPCYFDEFGSQNTGILTRQLECGYKKHESVAA